MVGLFQQPKTEDGINFWDISFLIIVLWPSLAIQAKRWHDRNKSALWILINFVPIIGPVWALIENGLLEGEKEKNKYGENPIDTKDTKHLLSSRPLTAKQFFLGIGLTFDVIILLIIFLRLVSKGYI
jgi:hypothetical protein